MIRRLHTLIARIQRLFAPKHKGADRSRLTAMYLDQTNRPSGDGCGLAIESGHSVEGRGGC